MVTPTIILPIYNGTRYLNEAIVSVLRQSYSSWKLLIVDDASSDDPTVIIRRHVDSRISYIRQDRTVGLYSSLSCSISSASSDWISIIMQDDRLKPNYLQEMISLAVKYPLVNAIWATEDIIDANGEVLQRGRTTRRLEIIQPGLSSWASVLQRGCIWTISGSFTRGSLLNLIPFRGDLPHCGDYEWLLRAIRQQPFLYFEESLAEIRQHEGQASTSNLRAARDVEETYKILRDNFAFHGRELSIPHRIRICLKRSRSTFARAARNCARFRMRSAKKLIRYGIRFLTLPFVCTRRRRL